jgi:hypothetical protein
MTCKTFTHGDLRALHAPLSNVRKQAIFFTLETRDTLDQTVLFG